MATNFIVKDTYTVIKKGDANADGIVNSFDYIRVMNYIMGRKQLNGYEKEAADANNDGIVNSFDYIRIMNYIMGTKKIELNKAIQYLQYERMNKNEKIYKANSFFSSDDSMYFI